MTICIEPSASSFAETTTTSSSIQENLLDESPFCVVVVSIGITPDGHVTYTAEQFNSTFEILVSPLFKIRQALEVCSLAQVLATTGQHQEKLLKALEAVSSGRQERARARSVETLTLAEADNGFPIKKYFDWMVTKSARSSQIIMYGDPCHEQDLEQRAKDAELVDFFHNAPIALHWLSGEGIVLWANQRELDVLGYTTEEYIGQPIMKFCPDEKELVLEIFQQLGSGNSIKDVPVRFRTKEGKIVHLLIDSNVKYDEFGDFQHTRCFIRDDTGRKVQEG
jgi:PAS domain S-box-containing protein